MNFRAGLERQGMMSSGAEALLDPQILRGDWGALTGMVVGCRITVFPAQETHSWAAFRCKTGSIEESKLGPINSKSSLRAVLPSGLFKKNFFLERSVGLQKGRAKRNLELRWERWWRRIQRNESTFLIVILGNNPGVSVSLPQKNLTLISGRVQSQAFISLNSSGSHHEELLQTA